MRLPPPVTAEAALLPASPWNCTELGSYCTAVLWDVAGAGLALEEKVLADQEVTFIVYVSCVVRAALLPRGEGTVGSAQGPQQT